MAISSNRIPEAPPTAASGPATVAGAVPSKRPLEEVSGPSSAPLPPAGANGSTTHLQEQSQPPRKKRKRNKRPKEVQPPQEVPPLRPLEPAPFIIKDEPMSPELGPMMLDDPDGEPMLPLDDDLEAGEVSSIDAVMRMVLEHAMEQNTILVMKEDCDILPVLLMRVITRAESLKPETTILKRPSVFIIPSTLEKRLPLWLDFIANRCSLTIGVIATEPLLEKESQEIWSILLTKDVIVANSLALVKGLSDDVVSLANFSLIVVDEAQRVHSHEPYTRLFTEFYKDTPLRQRPRVLGLTSQLLNLPDNFTTDVLLIEETLYSRVWGIDDAVRDKVSNQPQLVLKFDPPRHGEVSNLFHKIREIDDKELVFKNNFASAKFLVKELGPYAADMVWQRHASTHEARRNALVKDKRTSASFSTVEESRTKMIEIVRTYPFPKLELNPNSPKCNVSPKLLLLITILKGFEKEGANFRGVIFVHKRTTANSLADVLRSMPQILPFLRPRALIGVGAGIFDPHADHLTKVIDGLGRKRIQADVDPVRTKSQATNQFREGTINLLVATSVGYELDLGPCSVVIRFDVYEGQAAVQIQQSRVRKSGKMFLMLIEKGREKDVRAIAGVAEHEYKGKEIKAPQSAPIRRPNDGGMESDDDDDSGPFIEIPGTKSRVYPADAAQALTRYVSIQERTVVSLNCDYEAVDQNNRLFVCTIRFPPSVPLQNVTSTVCPSKADARRQAAYQACTELHKLGLLERILAEAGKKLKRLTKAQNRPHAFEGDEEVSKEVANIANKLGTRCYERKKPDLWKDSLSLPLDTLHPVIIWLDAGAEPLPGSHRTLCILTRLPLPKIAPFELYFPDPQKEAEAVTERTGKVRLLQCASMHMSAHRMDLLHRYTIRICRAATSKPYICDRAGMSFFFLPLVSGWTPDEVRVMGSAFRIRDEIIEWNEVQEAATSHFMPLTMDSLEEDIKDAIIQDREVEFTRRYEAVRVRHDLSPLSKPDDSLREQQYDSLLEYCRARRRGFTGVNDEHQPLIEVGRVPVPMNRLNPTARIPSGNRKLPAKYLIPELCVRYTLSASTYATAMLLPSIMSRVDELLLVKEMNANLFDGAINEHHLHIAVTSPSVGCGFDYERLELLGDAFLKYLASIYLFITSPLDGEGALHVLRQRIISNRALLFHSNRMRLPQYIQSKAFVPRSWWPLNYRVYQSSPAGTTNPAGENAQEDGATQGEGQADGPPPSAQTSLPALNAGVVRRSSSAAPAQVADHPMEGTSANGAASVSNAQPASVQRSHLEPAPAPMVLDDVQESLEDSNIRLQAGDAYTQWLGDKCIADVAEATIGAAYLTGERDLALTVSKSLGLPLSRANSWADFGRFAQALAVGNMAIPPDAAAKMDELQSLIGHRFKHPWFLCVAMTHASASTPGMPCYERLEFIGDAILDFLVVRHIYTRYGELSPGSLTLLKGAMVCNSALAAASVEVGLHEFIRHESVFLSSAISDYVKVLGTARDAEYAAAKAEGRPPGEYWVEHEPPKALSDVVESILGAVYVSENFEASGYEDVFDRLFKPFFLRHVSLNTLSHHPTKMLFERFQARSCQKFEILKKNTSSVTLAEVQCDVVCHGVVLASAIESTVVLASRHVSQKALDALNDDPTFLDRVCNCRQMNAEKKKAKRESYVKAQATDVVGPALEQPHEQSVEVERVREAPHEVIGSDEEGEIRE